MVIAFINLEFLCYKLSSILPVNCLVVKNTLNCTQLVKWMKVHVSRAAISSPESITYLITLYIARHTSRPSDNKPAPNAHKTLTIVEDVKT